MSRNCALTNRKSQKGNSIAIERSKVTKRSIKHFQLNIQKRRFKTQNLNICLKVSNKTLRTIEHKDGIENFLIKTKRKHLSPLARQYRKKLIKIHDIKFMNENKN